MGTQDEIDDEDDDDGTGGSGKRERSPNYPALTFTTALDRAEVIYKKEKRSPVSQDVAARHLGYSKLNGSSFQVLGALKRYGLLLSAGKKDVRISDDAHYIFVHPVGHPDRVVMERKLALSPSLFGKILGAFPDGLPSDENLVAKLQTDWNFKSEVAAKAFVKSLRDAVRRADGEVATPDPGEDTNGALIKETPMTSPPGQAFKTPLQQTTPPPPPGRQVIGGVSRQWEISEGRFVSISLPPDPTVEDMDALEEFLALFKQEVQLVWKRKARASASESKGGDS